MNYHKTIIGIDLGVTSIGWVLLKVACDEKNNPILDNDGSLSNVDILDIGVRIFPATVEDKSQAPKNQKRRESRGQRRLVRRKSVRRSQLKALLTESALLPNIDILTSSSEFNDIGDPYLLRAKAVDEKLEPFESGRAIYHLSKRRGFLSNRKSGQSKEDGAVLGGIKEIRETMERDGYRTLGEYLSTLNKKRKHFTHRSMAELEFETIWSKQAEYYPQIFNNDLKLKIRHIIFFQRPLKLQRNLIGKCTFETDKKRCDLARQQAQRFRYWSDLNNLAIQNPKTLAWRDLLSDEKSVLAKEMEASKELTYKKLRKLLRLDQDVKINLEANNKRLYGNRTAFSFRKAIGNRWDDLNSEEQDRLTEELIRIDNEEGLARRLKEFWGFDEATVEKVKGVWFQLEDGYSRLSLKAINKILPEMIGGKKYYEAITEKYGDHRKTFGSDEFQKLPLPPRDLRNPIVFKALCELRKVTNSIIREYGRPDEVRLEMARDLKLNQKQKEAMMKQANINKKLNEEAEKFYKERLDLESPSSADKLKYRLWKESGERCPYTGKTIPATALLDDGLVDIEHILPYSKTFDDSYMNKTICDAKFNREIKLNRPPYEIYDSESQEFAEMMHRVSSLPHAKQKKFRISATELNNSDFWIGRQLSDTRYICREARAYLRQLYPHSPDENKFVQVIAGGATAKLRYVWHINSILSDGDIAEKNRWDHRHHAIDAIVIALCSRGMYQQISKQSARNHDLRKNNVLSGFAHPWDTFLTDVQTAINELTVSHAPTRRRRGQLVEETAYGPTNLPGQFVVRKSLQGITHPAIKNIVDPAIKEMVELRLSQYGGDEKRAFLEPLFHKDGKTPINKVRVYVKMTPETVVGIADDKGDEYKFYPLAGNHHVIIYENTDTGERRAELVPRLYAMKHNWRPKGIGTEWTKLFTLCANDYVEFRGDDGKLKVYRVQKMSGGKSWQVQLRPLNDARSNYIAGETVVLTGSTSLNKIVAKLQVDPLGKITVARD